MGEGTTGAQGNWARDGAVSKDKGWQVAVNRKNAQFQISGEKG